MHTTACDGMGDDRCGMISTHRYIYPHIPAVTRHRKLLAETLHKPRQKPSALSDQKQMRPSASFSATPSSNIELFLVRNPNAPPTSNAHQGTSGATRGMFPFQCQKKAIQRELFGGAGFSQIRSDASCRSKKNKLIFFPRNLHADGRKHTTPRR
jgi:hypothetical protein